MTIATRNCSSNVETLLGSIEHEKYFNFHLLVDGDEGIQLTVPIIGTAHKTAFVYALHLHFGIVDEDATRPFLMMQLGQNVGEEQLRLKFSSETRKNIKLFKHFAMEGLYDIFIGLNANPNYDGNVNEAFQAFICDFWDIYSALLCGCDEHAKYVEQKLPHGHDVSSARVYDAFYKLFDLEPAAEILAGVMSLPIYFHGQSEHSFEIECHPAVLVEAMNRVVEKNTYLLDSAGLVLDCSSVTENRGEITPIQLINMIVSNLQIPTFYLTNGNVNAKKVERIRVALEREARVLTEAHLANNSQ